jgi:hypothetical protein
VDTTDSSIGFVPSAIQYKSSLIPMKKMSSDYVERANGVIEEAKKELESTTLGEEVRATFYPQLGVAERNSEMASIYLDQNYLYSSANFAFNARILAGAIKEIAANPSLLSRDSTILDSKIKSLEREITLAKNSMDYITLDNYEWGIGAQQRIAYAENALKNLEEEKANLDSISDDGLNDFLFDRVYEYVSAQAWLEAAKDFMDESKKSVQKRSPVYSDDFVKMTFDKISAVEQKISESTPSDSVLSEALRRLSSAKISYDNNFYFAALYDAYFAEAFVDGEQNREDYSDTQIQSIIETSLTERNTSFYSVWASLFSDHAYFFLENAKYEQGLGRTDSARSSLDTSYDLIILAGNIDIVKEQVDIYLASNNFPEYVEKPDLETTIDISYTKQFDVLQVMVIVFIVAVVVFLGFLIFFSIKTSQTNMHGPINTRIAKIERVRINLDSALTKKKINDNEYFFLKKRYDDELGVLKKERVELSHVAINLDESKAKLRALQTGLKSLKKHYKAGIIIEEDYQKHCLEINDEIELLKTNIKK